jgi:hypothetical protein
VHQSYANFPLGTRKPPGMAGGCWVSIGLMRIVSRGTPGRLA